MIRVSILYPNTEGSRFDINYYLNAHLALIGERVGAALKGGGADYGISGALPDSPPPFHAVGHFLFDSLESFYESFMPHIAEFQGDIPNYTDVMPIIQISEVKS